MLQVRLLLLPRRLPPPVSWQVKKTGSVFPSWSKNWLRRQSFPGNLDVMGTTDRKLSREGDILECLFPMLGFPSWKWSDKQHCQVFVYRIVKSAKNYFSCDGELNAKTVASFLSNYEPIPDPFGNPARPKLMPCGRCINCRLEYSRQWALRMCLERIHHRSDFCWFVTLTYDDDHLPKTENGLATCRIQDISDFMKRLRSYYLDYYNLDGIRFYTSTEYGDQTFRPHGHMILYGVPVSDLKPSDQFGLPKGYWCSPLLSRLWSKGNVLLGQIEFESCSYVARYVTKKVTGKEYKEKFEPFGIEQEDSRMSRRPGIGRFFYDPEIYGQIEQAVGPGRIFKRCKAFDRLMKDDNPIIYQELKNEAQKIVDLRLRSDPVSRSFKKRLDDLTLAAEENFRKKGIF